jgi:hypothetical protein
MATGSGELNLDVLSGARDEGHGDGVRDQGDDDVPNSGEFVFCNADNGGAAHAEDKGRRGSEELAVLPHV